MKKQLDINGSTFKRLEAIARKNPLTENTDKIINRALDALEREGQNALYKEIYDSHNTPDLSYTKILDWKCELPDPPYFRWHTLAQFLLDEAIKHVDHISELPAQGGKLTHPDTRIITHISELPVRGVRKSGKGFFLQPRCANDTFLVIVALVNFLKIQVEITVQWRDKQQVDASFRGKTAVLRIP